MAAAPRRTSRPRFTLGLIVLTAITLITLDYRADGGGVTGSIRGAARTVLAPIGDAVGFALTPIGNVVGGVLDFGRVRHENARLRDELAQSRSDVIAAQDAKRQLTTALDELNLDDPGDIPSVAARVTGSSPSILQFTFEIDKGSESGIARGMPVVSGGSLVGRIVRVTSSRSTVRLLSDPSLSVGVRLSRTGDLGVATGNGSRSWDQPRGADHRGTQGRLRGHERPAAERISPRPPRRDGALVQT